MSSNMKVFKTGLKRRLGIGRVCKENWVERVQSSTALSCLLGDSETVRPCIEGPDMKNPAMNGLGLRVYGSYIRA